MIEQKVAAGPQKVLTNGPAVAAIVAAGIGSLMLGLMTTLAEISEAIKEALNFTAPVGPLSGKTTVAIVAWLAAWILLQWAWGDRQLSFGKAFAASLVLIGLGLLGTFPLFFELFAH